MKGFKFCKFLFNFWVLIGIILSLILFFVAKSIDNSQNITYILLCGIISSLLVSCYFEIKNKYLNKIVNKENTSVLSHKLKELLKYIKFDEEGYIYFLGCMADGTLELAIDEIEKIKTLLPKNVENRILIYLYKLSDNLKEVIKMKDDKYINSELFYEYYGRLKGYFYNNLELLKNSDLSESAISLTKKYIMSNKIEYEKKSIIASIMKYIIYSEFVIYDIDKINDYL